MELNEVKLHALHIEWNKISHTTVQEFRFSKMFVCLLVLIKLILVIKINTFIPAKMHQIYQVTVKIFIVTKYFLI